MVFCRRTHHFVVLCLLLRVLCLYIVSPVDGLNLTKKLEFGAGSRQNYSFSVFLTHILRCMYVVSKNETQTTKLHIQGTILAPVIIVLLNSFLFKNCYCFQLGPLALVKRQWDHYEQLSILLGNKHLQSQMRLSRANSTT